MSYLACVESGRAAERASQRADITCMANWHLKELRASLEKRGWRVAAELPGDNRAISGSWDMKRAGDTCHLIIDFEGLDERSSLETPIEQCGSWRNRRFANCGSSAKATL